jgi:hypothetical protein
MKPKTQQPDRDRAQRLGLAATAAVLIAGVAGALHYARTNRPQAPPRPVASSVLPPGTEIRLGETAINGRDANGRPAWTIRAKRVDTDRNRSSIRFEDGIDAKLMDSDGSGKVRALVTAPRALFTEATKSLEVSGPITCRVPGEKGKPDVNVRAGALRWDVGQNRVLCTGEVVAQIDRDTVRAQELAVDLRTREWSARKVRARFFVGATDSALPTGRLPL